MRLLCGDALTMLQTLPDASVQCCVTSPPYWGLRDYGTATWAGYDADAIAEPAIHAGKLFTNDNGKNGQMGRYGATRTGFMGEGVLVRERRNRRSVWTVATEPFADAHFATFPSKLIQPMILAGSRMGDTILDPFCGSGTTGKVAIAEGRDFIGIDLNADYLTMAHRRCTVTLNLFAQEAADAP